MQTHKIVNLLHRAEDEIKDIKKQLPNMRTERYKEIYDEIAKAYPKLHEKPNWRHGLDLYCKVYVWIELLNDYLNDIHDINEFIRITLKIQKLIQTWSLLQTRLGLSYTATPYIPVSERKVESPSQVLEMQDKIKKIAENMKKKRKQIERTNKSGRRDKNHETIAEHAEREAKEAETKE